MYGHLRNVNFIMTDMLSQKLCSEFVGLDDIITYFYVLQDFEAINIDKRGFRLRLQKAARRLASLPIYTDVPVSTIIPYNGKIWRRF